MSDINSVAFKDRLKEYMKTYRLVSLGKPGTYSKIVDYQAFKKLESVKSCDIFPSYETTLQPGQDASLKGYIPCFFYKYPMDLGTYIDINKITTLGMLGDIPERIENLINKLHDNGIFHGDLHVNNIVIDPETKEVRLIDLDSRAPHPKSRWIKKMKKKVSGMIKIYSKFWDVSNDGIILETFNDLILYEKIMWKLNFIEPRTLFKPI